MRIGGNIVITLGFKDDFVWFPLEHSKQLMDGLEPHDSHLTHLGCGTSPMGGMYKFKISTPCMNK
jgi:hypothetical protein